MGALRVKKIFKLPHKHKWIRVQRLPSIRPYSKGNEYIERTLIRCTVCGKKKEMDL
jgi:hypothetical protein